jgi:hypothetical protein
LPVEPIIGGWAYHGSTRATGRGPKCPDQIFEESSMLDVLMVALALGFFAASVGYAYACDRL